MFDQVIVTLYTPLVLQGIAEAANLDADDILGANFEAEEVARHTLVDNLALTSALFDNAVLRILNVTEQGLGP